MCGCQEHQIAPFQPLKQIERALADIRAGWGQVVVKVRGLPVVLRCGWECWFFLTRFVGTGWTSIGVWVGLGGICSGFTSGILFLRSHLDGRAFSLVARMLWFLLAWGQKEDLYFHDKQATIDGASKSGGFPPKQSIKLLL